MKVPFCLKNIPGTDHSELGDGEGSIMMNVYRDSSNPPKIRKRPGLELFVDLGETSKVDGLHWWDEKGVVITSCAGKLFKITSADGSNSQLAGDVPNAGTIATFTSTGTYAFVASGGRIISYDNSANPAFIADTDAPTTVTHIGYLRQFILANKTGTGQFYNSDVNTPLSWIATDYNSAEMAPDQINALLVVDGQVLLFGRTTIETFYLSDSGIFALNASWGKDIGCLAPYSVVNLGGTVFWLGTTSGGAREVYQMDGGVPKVITGIDLTPILSQLSPAEEAFAIAFRFKDRAFYALSFTIEQRSFVYDVGGQEWFEWAGWDTESAEFTIFPARGVTYARSWGLLLFGDPNSGKIFKMSEGVFQDNLQPIVTRAVSGHINYGTDNMKRSRNVKIRVAGDSASGSNPVYSVSWNDDRRGFGNSLVNPISKEGVMVRYPVLGQYRTRQYKFEHSDNSDFILVNFEEDPEDLGR